MAAVDPSLADALRDRYLLERELGRGGMATVYLARDLRHDRLVALKVLRSDLAAALGPERFEREIRVAGSLQHPHILTVLDSGRVLASAGDAGRLWFTMPYVEGESLRARLEREGPGRPSPGSPSSTGHGPWRRAATPSSSTPTSTWRTTSERPPSIISACSTRRRQR